jgi:hypothetical protein
VFTVDESALAPIVASSCSLADVLRKLCLKKPRLVAPAPPTPRESRSAIAGGPLRNDNRFENLPACPIETDSQPEVPVLYVLASRAWRNW